MSITKSFILSSAGLKNLVTMRDEEFTFIFNDYQIKMNSIFAEFISPYVSQIHQTDPTIDSIKLYDTKTSIPQQFKKINSVIYSLLESLSKGHSIDINESQASQLQFLSLLLQNKEMFSKLDELFPNKIKNVDETILFLQLFQNNSIEYNILIKQLVNNIGSLGQDKINKRGIQNKERRLAA